ncbi:phage holin family protein [Sphingomonas sp. GlSt437]|uniref:phage holin family protein n=1 Tax=Sphingomonas sp. GlSt437 TaxID=3389970 RepID=UPI003A86000D
MTDNDEPDSAAPLASAEHAAPDISASGPVQPADDSFVALFTRLVDDVEDFVRAEVQLYRVELFSRLREGRTAIILIAVAFFLGQAALVALLVGLVATLRGPLGPAGATAVVVLGALAIAAVLGWVAMQRLRDATKIKDRQR